MQRRDVIIVGSGPAGSAVALRLASRAPDVAPRTLLLEKARHPRDKTCAGGVVPHGVDLLALLGVPLGVPHVRIDGAWVGIPGGSVAIAGADLCRVVRRRELDATLAWAARDRGVELREAESVRHVARDGDGVRVETDRGTYWAPVVIGADGSGSRVRRTLVSDGPGWVARAVMCDVPLEATRWDGANHARYDFDFSACARGLRGYRWTFPCVIDGRPHANVGAFALPPGDGRRVKAELAAELERIGAVSPGWKAHPIRAYESGARISAPHVLLVGDAAGIDPLLGEGISYALAYGIVAADAVLRARATGDWGFTDYERSVHRGPIGRKLRLLGLATRVFYGRPGRPAFALLARTPRLQRIGLDWYNGAGRFRRCAA